MKKSFSLKSVVFWVLGIDSLMIATAIGRAILLDRNPLRYFDERGFITCFSVVQLLFIAYLCWKISIIRGHQHSSLKGWKNPSRVWQIMTGGFIFLALDEYFGIHENIDVSLHELFNLNENGLTSRIDDFLILFYAIIGLFFLRTFKNEFQKFTRFSSVYNWFFAGFSMCFLTILLDMLSHKRQLLHLMVEDYEKLKIMDTWFKSIEEIPKIFAEGAFIIAFYYCLIIAKKLLRERQKERENKKISYLK